MNEMRNNNCLEGYWCPKCKSLEPFWIWGSTRALVYDSGINDYQGFDWADSWIKCQNCQYEAQASKFRRNDYYGDTDSDRCATG